jgi:hypothetical protein
MITVLFCSLFRLGGIYGGGMDEFEEEKQGQMSHEEILRRFNKLFCREMTAVERRAFFLDDPLPPEEEKV